VAWWLLKALADAMDAITRFARIALAAAPLLTAACATGEGATPDGGQPGAEAEAGGSEDAGGGDATTEGGAPVPPGDASTLDADASRVADGGSSADVAAADVVGPSEAGEAADAANAADAPAAVDEGAPPVVTGTCEPDRWTVTASVAAAVNPAAFATDGLPPTRWSSGVPQQAGQYFQVDFGGPVTLDRVDLDDSFGPDEHGDYPRGIQVLGSTDGTTFPVAMASQTFAADPGGVVTLQLAPGSFRALRLSLTAGDPTAWWSIHELYVGCSAPGSDGGSAADAGTGACPAPAWSASEGLSKAGWSATASAATNGSDAIANAFDGNAATRWSIVSQAGGEWFRVDLGQSTSMSEVLLYLLNGNTTDYPSAYRVDLSNDDQTYSPVASGVGAAPATAICFPRQQARYLRITQIGTGYRDWWSIYEMTIMP
jgi:hypothetical protein